MPPSYKGGSLGQTLCLRAYLALLLAGRVVRTHTISLFLFHLLCKAAKPDACRAKIFGIANCEPEDEREYILALLFWVLSKYHPFYLPVVAFWQILLLKKQSCA